MSLAHLLLGLLAFGGTAGVLSGQYQHYVLDPYSRRSPSGIWVLEVDSSASDGAGEGLHRMMREGKEVWSATLPYTLWDAEVADDGSVAGYAYTLGMDGYGLDNELRLVILDPDGKRRLDSPLPRIERAYHEVLHPAANGILLDPDLDRVVFRVQHAVKLQELEEQWMCFELSTGKPSASSWPKEQLSDVESLHDLVAVRRVPSTPLTLCQWFSSSFGPVGTRFVLLDVAGAAVWTLDLPNDYRIEPEAMERLLKRVREGRAVLGVGPARFEIALVEEAKRVTLEVMQDPASPQGWRVKEIERANYELPIEAPALEPNFGKPLTLELLGTVELQDAQTENDPSDVQRLDKIHLVFVDHLARILIVDQGTKAVHVFDREGRRIAVFVSATVVEHYPTSMAVAGDGTVYLRFFGEGDFAFSRKGEWLGERSLGGKCNFFHPGKETRWRVSTDEIELLDAEGKLQRRIQRKADRTWFRHIHWAAVAPDGALAVIEFHGYHGSAALSVFAPDGEAVSAMELATTGILLPQVAFAEGRLFFWRGGTLYCFELATKTLRTATPGPEVAPWPSQPFWEARSKELWLFGFEARKFWRYRVGD